MPKAKTQGKKAKSQAKSQAKIRAKKTKTPALPVGEMMREAREAANMSQDELAHRLKTRRTAISRIENHAQDIKLSTLSRLAEALGKTLKVKIV